MTVTDKPCLTLRGVALRGDHVKTLEELANGVALVDGSVTVRTAHDQLVGEATLDLIDGDVHVTATVPASEAAGLTNAPYLAVALRLSEEGPAEVAFVLVTGSATDPFQLPYRLTDVPSELEDLAWKLGYEPVTIVDERHDVEITYDYQTGKRTAVYDPDKSHVEWRHDRELSRLDLPDAVARGFGYTTWMELAREETGNGLTVARSVLDEVTRLGLT